MTATHLMEKSLQFCCQRENITRDKVIRGMQSGCCYSHSNFRYAVAKNLCRILANENDINAIYLHGSTVKDKARVSSDIDLVLHVRRKEKELSSRLEQLNFELLSYYKELLDGYASSATILLDVQLVDDYEVRQRTGYGVLISSLFNRPLKLWSNAG
ncbi:MAG: hypothetical protein FH756_12645 [Firmicutes bacterium]|nr:hypothetical protein [Bacillota bacterium]